MLVKGAKTLKPGRSTTMCPGKRPSGNSAGPGLDRQQIDQPPSTSRSPAIANYVDGFVLPTPKRNLEAYRRMARKAGKAVWFSWIMYKSRKHRDGVMAKVMVRV